MTAGSRIRAALDRFEQTYGVPRGWALTFNAFGTLIFPVFGWLLALEDTHHAAFLMLTHKLGVIGLPYTLSFLLASLLGVSLSRRARRHGAPKRVWLTHAVLALFCFFVAMEHISWGQAAFHFRTPFGYGHVNKLGLFNLHNLPGLDEAHSFFLLVCGVAGGIGLWLNRQPRFRGIAVPPILTPLVVAIMFMSLLEILVDFVYLGFMFDMNVFVLRYAIEFVIGLTCLIYIWLNGRLLARDWAAAPSGA